MDPAILKALVAFLVGLIGFLVRYIWTAKTDELKQYQQETKALKRELQKLADDLLSVSSNNLRIGIRLEQAVGDLNIQIRKVETLRDLVQANTSQLAIAREILKAHDNMLREQKEKLDAFGKIIHIKKDG